MKVIERREASYEIGLKERSGSSAFRFALVTTRGDDTHSRAFPFHSIA